LEEGKSMAVVIETLMAEDLELGISPTTKTHPSGGTLNGTQISLSTFSLCAASGYAPVVAWDPGTIASGSQAVKEIDAPGAASGDKVLAALTTLNDTDCAPNGELLISAHVSSDNHVTVILANLTGVAVTVQPGTLSVLVFRHRMGSL
jgi:hypothetical protein